MIETKSPNQNDLEAFLDSFIKSFILQRDGKRGRIVVIERELYIKVLECLNDEQCLAKKMRIIQERDFQVIGDVIIRAALEKITEVNIMQIKKIVCIRLGYNQDRCSKLTYEELCVLVCQSVVEFKTYPADEYQQIKQSYNRIKNKYDSIIKELENKILSIESLIKNDKEHPQHCGSLIKKQNQLQSRNNVNKSILKDLKKIEEEYYTLFDLIQENYVYGEMLKYAKAKIEAIFKDTIFLANEDVDFSLRKMAIEIAKKESGELKSYKSNFKDYDICLESWKNAVESIYKPFYMIKMRKFIDDIEKFYNQNYNGVYWNRTEELIEICKEKRVKVLDSDQWINLRIHDLGKYNQELKTHVSEYQVLDYISRKTDELYCLQNRKNILNTIIDSFENQNYVVFMNLVVIQIEGLFYDMFVDANIQNRLDGQFDLFEKDDLKIKIEKNDTSMGIEEAVLYFKFYFNSMIRNKVAHGRNGFSEEEYERISFELLLDLQYVIHLLEKHSDTNEAVEYVKNTISWLEFSFAGDCTQEQIYEKLLNSLNDNVIKHKNGFMGYVDSHQELYWIFNPYYEAAYEYANVIELREKLRDYLTSENFGDYVLNYIQTYAEQETPHIRLKQEFISRAKAMQAYVAKNKRMTLPLVSEVIKKMETMQLH